MSETEQIVCSTGDGKNRKVLPLKIIIGLILILLVLIVAVLFLGRMSSPRELGITMNGRFYKFSAQTGITDYQEMQDGVYTCNNNMRIQIYKPGATAPEPYLLADGSEAGLRDTYEVPTYWVSNYRQKRSNEQDVVASVFVFNNSYKTMEGLTTEDDTEDAKKSGYRPYMGHYLACLADEKGRLDWKAAEKLADRVIKEDSFACLKEIDEPFSSCLGDVFKFSYRDDDVKAFLERMESAWNIPVYDSLVTHIALAMETQKILDGEKDFFVMQTVRPNTIGGKEHLIYEVYIITHENNLEKWDENWGVTIE